MKRILLPLLMALAAALLVAPAAHAGDVRCTGKIGARSIGNNVVVPKGKTCTLAGTRVDGNVKVRPGARLNARGAKIEGNIQATSARYVLVSRRWNGQRYVRTRVDGDIQLDRGRGSNVRFAVIDGNLQVKQNRSRRQFAVRNRINGDLQAFSNRGGYRIFRNVIDGNLQCKSNKPRPGGGKNKVSGNKENQCRRL